MPGISLIMAICEGSFVYSHGIAYMVANCHKFPDSRLLAHLSLQVANCQGVICMNICLCTVCTLPGPPGLFSRQRSKSVCYAGWLPLCGDEGGGQQGPQGAGEQPQCPQQSHQPLLSTANQDQARTHNSIVWLVWEQGTGINNNSIIHRNVRVIWK